MHFWPVEPFSYQVKSSFDPQMTHVLVQFFEDQWLVGVGNYELFSSEGSTAQDTIFI